MTPAPRILLLHASVGRGHYRAATALAHAFEQTAGATIYVDDILRYAGAFFRKSYTATHQLAYLTPRLWSQIYALTDHRVSSRHPSAIGRALGTRLGMHALSPLLAETRPDAIVCTHFLPVEALNAQRRKHLPPVYLAVTDYRAHNFWACPHVDGYFAPTDAVRDQLVGAGVPRSRVYVTGIPIDPSIARPREPEEARAELRLPPRGPVVLLSAGGIVPERVRAIVAALLARRFPGTLLVVAGGNQGFIASLADLESAAPGVLRLWGEQPSLDRFIVASDLVVSKAGGLTVSEALARGVPLIIPTPAPGQESWNVAYVVEGGAGMRCAGAGAVADAVMSLIGDPARRHRMAEAAYALGRPEAALAIAGHVLADLARRFGSDGAALETPARGQAVAAHRPEPVADAHGRRDQA
jgi:processive 1,2-diacylglycerol beta-glucosyltransferase